MTEVRTNELTNIRSDERKGENYIPVGINAGGIIKEKKHNYDLVFCGNLMSTETFTQYEKQVAATENAASFFYLTVPSSILCEQNWPSKQSW